MANKRFQNLKTNINSPELFFSELQRQIAKEKSTSLNPIIDFLNDNEIDICIIAVEAINNGYSAFKIEEILKSIFPQLKFDKVTLIQFFKSLFVSMKGDLCFDKQYGLLESLHIVQPDLINELKEGFLDIDEEFVVDYIAKIYEFKIEDDGVKAHHELLGLIKKKSGFILNGLVFALSKFDYNKFSDNTLLTQSLAIYKNLVSNNNDELDSTIAFGLKPILTSNPDAQTLLCEIAKKKGKHALYQVSKVLYPIAKEHYKKTWFKQSIQQFIEVDCTHLGILKNLDQIFKIIIESENDITSFEHFLHSWIPHSNFMESESSIDEIWLFSIDFIRKGKRFFPRLLTGLFNSDESECHLFASELVTSTKRKSKDIIKLDPELLVKYEFNDIVYVCRKIMGYLISVNEIYGLLNSILQCKKEDEKVVEFICHGYTEHLAKDFLYSTSDLVNTTLETLNEEDKLLLKYLNNVKGVLDKRKEVLASLPSLKELSVSKKEIHQLRLEETKTMNKLMDLRKKKTFIDHLGIKTTPLRYGNGWFHYHDGEYSEVSYLKKFSESFEMPRTEITQPVKSSYFRLTLRLAKRTDR